MLTYKEAREKIGLSQSEVARRIGISRETYALKESYDRQFKDCEIMKYCQIVHVNIEDLKIKGYNY